MLNVRKAKKRLLFDKVKKFIGEFMNLKYDGTKIICLECDRPLICWDKGDSSRRINGAHHTYKKLT